MLNISMSDQPQASARVSVSIPDDISLEKPFYDQPSFARYVESIKHEGCTHIPIVREILADLDTPVSTYLKLANRPYTYLFESVQGGDKWGRYSIIGLPCKTVYRVIDNRIVVEQDGAPISVQDVASPLAELEQLRDQYKVATYDGLPDVIGGLVGYFGYESVAYFEPRLAIESNPDLLETPDIMLMVSEEVLVFDNLSGRIYLVCLADLSDVNAFEKTSRRFAEIERSLTELPLPSRSKQCNQHQDHQYIAHFEQEKFEAAVERCKQYIRDGDIMQVVLSQRLTTQFNGDSFDIYRALRTINPSPYMYYLNMGDFDIVGSSPEILVRMENNKVTVRPIAGTRRRGIDAQQDAGLAAELLADEKELAEHVMLIDLGRNDVGRVAKTGTVALTERMQVERYSHVMHIVSNIEGELADKKISPFDVLRAVFPAGTVSGAPKVRAMEIIHDLEPIKRGVYSGAVGYLGWQGNMDTAIAIRTAILKDGVLSIQAGAGIVADSVAELEWQETLNKAKAVVRAVALARNNLGVLS